MKIKPLDRGFGAEITGIDLAGIRQNSESLAALESAFLERRGVPMHDKVWCAEATLTHPEVLQAVHEDYIRAGAELIALEMMQKPEVAVPAVEAALATGLPVWIGVSCRLHRDSNRLTLYNYADRDLSELLQAVSILVAGAITVMHSRVDDTEAGLRSVREYWRGPLGAYPNSGYFTMPNWQFVDVTPPAVLLERAREWIDLGAQLIGGCCGLGPEHIAALRDGLPQRIDAADN